MIVRSIYTLTEPEVREMLIKCDQEELRRGLLKMLDSFGMDSQYLYTVDEPTMKKIRGAECE